MAQSLLVHRSDKKFSTFDVTKASQNTKVSTSIPGVYFMMYNTHIICGISNQATRDYMVFVDKNMQSYGNVYYLILCNNRLLEKDNLLLPDYQFDLQELKKLQSEVERVFGPEFVDENVFTQNVSQLQIAKNLFLHVNDDKNKIQKMQDIFIKLGYNGALPIGSTNRYGPNKTNGTAGICEIVLFNPDLLKDIDRNEFKDSESFVNYVDFNYI